MAMNYDNPRTLQQMMEEKMWWTQQQEMKQYGQYAPEPAREPEKPFHLNPKLLLLKGA